MRFRPIFVFAALLITTACAERGAGPILSTGERYAADASGVSEYRLDVGDRIKINVFNEPTLSGEFSVAANGSVSLPLLGDVPATGRTVDQLIAEARTRLADGFLRDPKVSGEVSVFRPYFILGEVDAPGNYPYAVGLTAMNAIAAAKGFTPRANRDVVLIRRKGETSEVNYRLTPQLMIYPGDTIRVGERYF